jgi:hypothetical protein
MSLLINFLGDHGRISLGRSSGWFLHEFADRQSSYTPLSNGSNDKSSYESKDAKVVIPRPTSWKLERTFLSRQTDRSSRRSRKRD